MDSSATPGSVLLLVLGYRAGYLLAGPFPNLAHALFLGLLRHEFHVAEMRSDRSDATDTFHVSDDCLGHTESLTSFSAGLPHTLLRLPWAHLLVFEARVSRHTRRHCGLVGPGGFEPPTSTMSR